MTQSFFYSIAVCTANGDCRDGQACDSGNTPNVCRKCERRSLVVTKPLDPNQSCSFAACTSNAQCGKPGVNCDTDTGFCTKA